ncbi:response regulator [Acidisphaera sp. S103]|uniref:response regulator n=1 Tax=Acidisphaera sp. S103 TaxID=1747223 RepID=UPI00131CCC9A|nr:response regulator [Acidisphaera sp. S103]
MKLSTRLVLLTLGCLLPILTAQIYSQVNLYAERHRQLSALVLRQAELANADMASIVDGVHQLGVLAGEFPSVRTSGEPCTGRLTSLRQSLTQYRFLALFSPVDGSLLCTSDGVPTGLSAHPSWLANLLTTKDLSVGQLVSDPTRKSQFLPIAVHVRDIGAGDEPRVLVVALDTNWLEKHLETAKVDHAPALSHAALIIADRNGYVLSRVPDSAAWTGRPVPDWFRPLIGRPVQGVETIVDPHGHSIIAAYVPNESPPAGLTTIDALVLPDLTVGIDHATFQDLLLIGGAAFVAVILTWVAGRRFIYQPTEALLQAARKWREGDLGARARLTDAGSEFAALAESFNAMAAGLQAREMERRMQASFLEAQVAERTRELSESNNRLQVEIAGREKTEVALHQARKLQAVGQLAGGIAHDFNNMLATVLGNLELMERRVSQAGDDWAIADTDRLLRLIERATGAVTRGGQLTSRLLAFSRRQPLTARATDVNALLRELITLAASTLGRRIQVISELADDLWPAMIDPSQVEAAILNLCLNARDAMPDGGHLTIRTMNLTVEPGTGEHDDNDLSPGEYVQVSISDTGTGMTAEVKARAFDPFFTTKGPSAGSGLGLSQVYGMARQSGGNVVIDSTLNEGTRVMLSLPRAAATEASDTAETESSATLSAPSTPNELILVVDDDSAVRQVTVEMAHDLGCEVVQASGGEQALSLIDKLSPPPTLILLDYAMPGMNGLQLARALRERRIKAPIALVTGYAELSETDIAAEQLSGLLRKPFTIRELQGLLTRLRAAAPSLEAGLVNS